MAAIQLAREERMEQLKNAHYNDSNEDDQQNQEDEDEDNEEDDAPVGAADGSSGKQATNIWAGEDEKIELSDDLFGTLDIDAEKEAKAAAKHASKMSGSSSRGDHQSVKKSRHV